MERSTRFRWASRTCFVSNEKILFGDYGLLQLHYPHWRPRDLKAMTPRERNYWLKMAEWKLDQQRKRVEDHG